jgi:hypothetical protein
VFALVALTTVCLCSLAEVEIIHMLWIGAVAEVMAVMSAAAEQRQPKHRKSQLKGKLGAGRSVLTFHPCHWV